MENSHQKPYIINFQKIGNPSTGYISIAELEKNIPFNIKRVYWTYFTPNDVDRGFHAHKELQQVIVAVSGVIKFNLKNDIGEELEFILDDPSKGLMIPKMHWREISFSHNAVLLCLASEIFDEKDYLRNLKEFTTTKI
jgi:hypothetical protein